MGQGGPGQTLLTPPKPASWSPRGQDRTNYLPNCMVLKAPRHPRDPPPPPPGCCVHDSSTRSALPAPHLLY